MSVEQGRWRFLLERFSIKNRVNYQISIKCQILNFDWDLLVSFQRCQSNWFRSSQYLFEFHLSKKFYSVFSRFHISKNSESSIDFACRLILFCSKKKKKSKSILLLLLLLLMKICTIYSTNSADCLHVCASEERERRKKLSLKRRQRRRGKNRKKN